MKKLYVEAALDAYKYLDRNIYLLDTKIIRKAMGSVRRYDKSCEELAVEIIELQYLKFDLMKLKKVIDDTLSKLNQNEKAYVYRRYLHIPCSDIHTLRKTKKAGRLLSVFGAAFELNDIDNDRFEEMFQIKVLKDSLNHVKRKHNNEV